MAWSQAAMQVAGMAVREQWPREKVWPAGDCLLSKLFCALTCVNTPNVC